MTTYTPRDFPALDGRPVTEAHARVCAERGHATHTVDGVPSGTCPRCGAVTESGYDQYLRQLERENGGTGMPVQTGAEYPTLLRGRVSDEVDDRPSADADRHRRTHRDGTGRGMTQRTVPQMPTLPGKVDGIVGWDPLVLQCRGCGRVHVARRQRRRGATVILSGFRFHTCAAGAGRRCPACLAADKAICPNRWCH